MAQDTPKWLKHAIIYEVFVRNHSVEGTFDKVREDLERIQELGVDIVWLMPIHPISEVGRKGTYGCPYAIQNYREISKDLGDEVSLKRLIDKTHELGMKIIIDVVYNHTGRDSNLTEEHPEWYFRDPDGNLSRKVEDWSDVYDLDYSDKTLWEYQIRSLEKWSNLGIDGFRCDVAPMVPLDFWIEARKRLNREKEVIWLAESVHPSFVKFLRSRGYIAHSDPELHQVFDLTYDYDGHEYLDRYWPGEGSLKEYLEYLFVQETRYPEHAIKMRFVENHDQSRIASIISDTNVLKNWTAFYLLLPGASLIYAGQEIRASRLPELFEKDPIQWENGDEEFLVFFKKMVAISKTIKSKCETFTVRELARGVVRIDWSSETEEYTALLNLEDKYGDVEFIDIIQGKELLTDQEIQISEVYTIKKEPVIIQVNDAELW
jgi:cyclomaltodextrinase